MKYQIKDRNSFFVRKDGNASIVLFKEKHDQFILNSTGLVMFELILDSNETEDVLEKLKSTYRDIKEEVLYDDLQDIIRMLSMYGILSYEEENTQERNEQLIAAVDEIDYEKVACFIENNRSSDCFTAGGRGYYTAVNIRAHVINNQEYYYRKIDADGNIEGAIVIVPNINNNSVVIITALVTSREKSEEERQKIGKELIEYVKKSMINQVNKLRISFYANTEENIRFLKMFKSLGFEKEAELKNEYENSSLYLYSMFD